MIAELLVFFFFLVTLVVTLLYYAVFSGFKLLRLRSRLTARHRAAHQKATSLQRGRAPCMSDATHRANPVVRL